MTRTMTAALVAAAAVLAAGCLQKETRHVVYLTPDGRVSWTATESDVHSDESDPAARMAEEQEYLWAAQGGTHRVAQGLAALGPVNVVRTQIVRADRPFTVVTEAPFESIARTLQRLFAENGLQAAISLRQDASLSVLHIRIDFGSYAEVDSPAAVLLEDSEDLALVLTEGSFVQSDGFRIDPRGRSASISRQWLERAAAAFEANGRVDLGIAWRMD